MSQLTGLTGEYIRVRRSGSGRITYGGDQGFFKGAPSGSEDERKQKMGCGITAFGDLLLYLASQNREYLTKENACYANRTLFQQEYERYFSAIYEYMGGIRKGAKSGNNGFKLQRKFNCMAKSQNWKLRAKWGLSGRKLYGRIVEMLEQDIPVILCIPMLFGRKNKGQGISFYKKEDEAYCKVCTVTEHFVVITSIINEDGDIYFKISSWGNEYYVNWKEYNTLIHTHFLGTILGNILYIR